MSRLTTHNQRPTTRRGSAVMEAALVFPVLLTLTFGSIECGHYFFVKHTFQGAAREGARAAIPPGATNNDVITAVAQTMKAAGYENVPTVKYTVAIRNATDTADINVATATAATGILVKVSGVWGTIGVRPMAVLDSAKPVVGQTVMRKEG